MPLPIKVFLRDMKASHWQHKKKRISINKNIFNLYNILLQVLKIKPNPYNKNTYNPPNIAYNPKMLIT